MKQEVKIFDDLKVVVRDLVEAGNAVSITKLENGSWEVQYLPHKKYIAQDGETYPDEVWITAQNEMFFIQNLTEGHAKNIIRMILRQEREDIDKYDHLKDNIASALSSISSDDVTDFSEWLAACPKSGNEPPKGTLLH